MPPLDIQSFSSMRHLNKVAHGFVLRIPHIKTEGERAEVLALLRPAHEEAIRSMGFSPDQFRTVSQVHGRDVLNIDADRPDEINKAGFDGMITNQPGTLLGIYVADCCAIYLVDPRNGAIGLLHSGKNGTALGIAPNAIALMGKHYGTDPGDLIVQLSPCIRPPDYEVDFAAEIRRQCAAARVPPTQIHDGGENTASDLNRFYSYRMEKGRTGRMLALLGIH